MVGVLDSEIGRSKPRRVVRNRDDLTKVQCLYDRFEVTELLLETVGSAGRLIGGAKPQEVERNDPPPGRYQVGDQIVPDV